MLNVGWSAQYDGSLIVEKKTQPGRAAHAASGQAQAAKPRRRLERRRREMTSEVASPVEQNLRQRLSTLLGRDLDLEEIDDLTSGEVEELESEVADAATASKRVACATSSRPTIVCRARCGRAAST